MPNLSFGTSLSVITKLRYEGLCLTLVSTGKETLLSNLHETLYSSGSQPGGDDPSEHRMTFSRVLPIRYLVYQTFTL